MESTTDAQSNHARIHLARAEKFTLVTVGILQAIALYVVLKGIEHNWLPLLVSQVTLITLVLIVPTVFMLSLRVLADRLFWQHIGLLVLIFASLAWYSARIATSDYFLPADHVLSAFAVVMFLVAFAAVPFLQSRLQWRSWRMDYPSLFKNAWQNTLTLALAFFFILISWGLLMLWAALFRLINISFFFDLFTAEAFVAAMSGFLFGMGILIGRTQEHAIQTSRKLIFALCTGLLPVAAFVLLIFLATLPFVGFSALWHGTSHVSMAVTLSVLLVFLIVLFNAVFQLGDEALPYSRILNWLVRAALALSPILGVLAVAAVWVRIGDYGWTAERYWAFLAVALLALYSLGYSASCWLRKSNGWTWIPRINVGVALLGMLIATLSFTPVLNPYPLAANSQAERMVLEGRTANEIADKLEWFRFSAGVYGIRVLEDWEKNEEYQGIHDEIALMLARTHRYMRPRRPEIDEFELSVLINRIQGPAPGDMLDEQLTEEIGRHLLSQRCLQTDVECIGNWLDLMQTEAGEAIPESGYLLCVLDKTDRNVACSIFGHEASEGEAWTHMHQFVFHYSEEINQQIRDGDVVTRMPCARVLSIGGQHRAVTNFSCY